MSNLQKFNQTIANPRTQDYLMQLLGEKKSSFVNNLTALVSNNSQLQICDPLSVMYAGIRATTLDLPLDTNLGFAYVIPFKNTKENKYDAQFQIGYRGFIQLAMRSGQFKTINVRDVKEGEVVAEDFVSGEIQFQKLEKDREKAATIGYVAYFRLTNGFEKMSYMTKSELEAHGKRFSQTFKKGYGLWKDDFDSMASKTVLKLLLSKYAPLSIEMQNAIKSDQAIITDKEEVYIDNQNLSENSQKAAEIIEMAFDEIECTDEIETEIESKHFKDDDKKEHQLKLT